MVTFALYNGLVVLPIILSHLGPNAVHHFTKKVPQEKSGAESENQEFELKKKMLTEENAE